MGLIAVIDNFARAIRKDVTNSRVSDVTFNPGGGANITGEHYSNPGDDAYPVLTDIIIAVSTLRTGGYAVVGYADTINTPKANMGEKRIYARDSNGVAICDIWLKSDKSVIIDNGSGSLELKINGDVDINGVIIKANGDVSIPGLLSINGKDFDTHIHAQGNDSAGDIQVGTTGVI